MVMLYSISALLMVKYKISMMAKKRFEIQITYNMYIIETNEFEFFSDYSVSCLVLLLSYYSKIVPVILSLELRSQRLIIFIQILINSNSVAKPAK